MTQEETFEWMRSEISRLTAERDDWKDKAEASWKREDQSGIDLFTAEAANTELRTALQQIARGEGRFSRDQLTHANNTIEDMKELAESALKEIERLAKGE